MDRQFGGRYARVWADHHVMGNLDGQTASEALEAGVPPKAVWRAVHENLGLPAADR